MELYLTFFKQETGMKLMELMVQLDMNLWDAIEIECTVTDSLAAFDNPAVYKVDDVEIIEGPEVPINEVASYTHTYAGQAREGERITARGKLEKVIGEKYKL